MFYIVFCSQNRAKTCAKLLLSLCIPLENSDMAYIPVMFNNRANTVVHTKLYPVPGQTMRTLCIVNIYEHLRK